MSGNELRQAREAAGVSLSELAADLGTVWSAVWKLERRGSPPGSRTVPPHVAERAPDLLRRRAAARPDPIEQARTRLRAAAAAEPGLPGWRLLQAAGYGKSNRTAQAVLRELLDAGELHLRVTPMRAPHSGSRLAVHPGPAPAGLEQPTPLPGVDLLRRRRAAGLRQRDLAAALGVNQTVVSQWERGAVPHLRMAAVVQALEDLGRERAEPLSGDQLRRARQAAGLSQTALGAALGVTQVSVAGWERRGVPRDRVDEVRRVLAATPLEDLGRKRAVPLSGDLLRRARQAAGLRQRDLAAALGVTQSAVAGWERRGVPRDRVDDVRRALSAGA